MIQVPGMFCVFQHDWILFQRSFAVIDAHWRLRGCFPFQEGQPGMGHHEMTGNHAESESCKDQSVSFRIVAAVIVDHMVIDRKDWMAVLGNGS